MTKKDLSGKQLERLVAMLESIFAGTNATIEAPCRRLIDRDTGRPREHDVVITWDHGHHRIITAIECRDRSCPVGVPAIEAFADKCSRTGVHSGVVVSATGFAGTARKKADARSITCMDLAEVEKFDWLAVTTFAGYQRFPDHIDLRIKFKSGEPETLGAIYDRSGAEISKEEIADIAVKSIPKCDDPEEEVGKETEAKLRLQTENWTASDNEGAIWQIEYINANITYTTKKTLSPIKSHRYTGGGKDYSFAVADVTIGEIPGKFFMVREQDESTSIFWTPDKHLQPIKPSDGEISV